MPQALGDRISQVTVVSKTGSRDEIPVTANSTLLSGRKVGQGSRALVTVITSAAPYARYIRRWLRDIPQVRGCGIPLQLRQTLPNQRFSMGWRYGELRALLMAE